MLRRLLERLARNLVLRRSLPAEFRGQPLYVSPDARLAYLAAFPWSALAPGMKALKRRLCTIRSTGVGRSSAITSA